MDGPKERSTISNVSHSTICQILTDRGSGLVVFLVDFTPWYFPTLGTQWRSPSIPLRCKSARRENERLCETNRLNATVPGATTMNSTPTPSPLVTRRRFVSRTTAALSAAALPHLVHAQTAGKIKLGLIGCGKRGQWIADLFQQNGNYELVACADYFQDRVDSCGEKFGIPAAQRFTGLSGYKRMLEGKVEAVAIESPPYFHPMQAADAVAAGKHVYVAKPVAVDVPGCQSVAESGKQATAKKLAFLVDFQTRANECYQKAIERVHAGAIGTFTFGEARYHCGQTPNREGDFSNESEERLRHWNFDKVLSGDIITEQNVHTLDVMSWILQRPPLHVIGSGGRKVRMLGDTWDHFSLLFQYPDDVAVVFTSKQYNDGASDAGIIVDIFGSLGRISTKYGGQVMMLGKDTEYVTGKTGDIYKAGVVTNIAAFHQMIASGDFSNRTVAPSVESTIVTIMGRTAAYERRMVTWDEIVKCTKLLDPKLSGLKA